MLIGESRCRKYVCSCVILSTFQFQVFQNKKGRDEGSLFEGNYYRNLEQKHTFIQLSCDASEE